MDFAVAFHLRVKIKESEKKKHVLGSCRRSKKATEHEVNGDTNNNWRTWRGHQILGKGTGRLGNWRTRPSNL